MRKDFQKIKHQLNNDKESKVEFESSDRLKNYFEENKLVISFEKSNEDKWIKDLNQKKKKKVVFTLNVSKTTLLMMV